MHFTINKIIQNNYWILLLLIAIKFILQFTLVNPVYELHRDEFLHLDQAFHPAVGFISVPPFTSWMASIIYLFGGGIFWVRFIPAFFGALTVVFAWLITEELGGKLSAKILTSVLLIFSVFTRLNVLFQPNAFDILAWTIVFYILIKYNKTQNFKWLYLFAIITALAFYNKYTITFLIFGLLVAILLTSHRKVFTRKHIYFAIGLLIVLIFPNIIWQINNRFPVLHHMQALNENQLVNVNRLDFLIDQLKFGMIGLPTLAAFWALIFYKPFKSYRFICFTFIIVMTIFTISRAKNYYALGLYPVLFALGSAYIEVILKKWKVAVISILAITNIVAFFIIVKYIMPFQSPEEIIANKAGYERIGLLQWEDGENHALPQDFADMLGWKEMADKAYDAFKMIPANEVKNTLIFCDNYGQAGALNYYHRNKMPEAYSFSTDYIYWLPEKIELHHVLLIGGKPDEEVLKMFAEYKLVAEVENIYARENGTQIFLLLNAKPGAGDIFTQISKERKENFDIF